MSSLPLSVIVTLQHTHTLDLMLGALAQQRDIDRNSYEVIVIDGLRKRPWQEVINRHSQTAFRLIFREIPPCGRARATNVALALASGSVVLLLADDFIPSPGVLASHLAFHGAHPEEEMAAVGPGVFPARLRHSFIRRWIEDSSTIFGVSFTQPVVRLPKDYFYAANTSLKRGLLNRAGLFDERFPQDAWDDFEYGQRLRRLGYQARYLPDALCEHEHPVTLKERLHHMDNAGGSAYLYELSHPETRHGWQFKLPSALPPLPDLRPSLWRRLGKDLRIGYLRRHLDDAFLAAYQQAKWGPDRASPEALRLDREARLRLTEIRQLKPEKQPSPAWAAPSGGTLQQAHDALQQGDLDQAERLHLTLLLAYPRDARLLDAMARIRLLRGRAAEATEWSLHALDHAGRDDPDLRIHLGQCLAMLGRERETWAGTPRPRGDRHPAKTALAVPVQNDGLSILMPISDNLASTLASLESLVDQEVSPLEVILLDGSQRGFGEKALQFLSQRDCRSRLINLPDAPMHACLNEGLRLAGRRHGAILMPGDRYEPGGLAALMRHLTATGAAWAFSNARTGQDGNADFSAQGWSALAWHNMHADELPTAGHGFLRGNPIPSPSLLTFEIGLARACGGFRAMGHLGLWDFALRCLWRAEPHYLPTPLVSIGPESKVSHLSAHPDLPGRHPLLDYLDLAFSSTRAPNALAPSYRSGGLGFIRHCLEGNLGAALPPRRLFEAAAALLDGQAALVKRVAAKPWWTGGSR